MKDTSSPRPRAGCVFPCAGPAATGRPAAQWPTKPDIQRDHCWEGLCRRVQ